MYTSIDDICNIQDTHQTLRKQFQTTTLDHPMLTTTAMSTMMQPTGHKGMSPLGHQPCPTMIGGMIDHSNILG